MQLNYYIYDKLFQRKNYFAQNLFLLLIEHFLFFVNIHPNFFDFCFQKNHFLLNHSESLYFQLFQNCIILLPLLRLIFSK